MKKVLITGVYGLIGNAVYRRLLDHPEAYEVHGLSRRRHSSDRISEAAVAEVPDAQFHLAHLEDFNAVRQAVEGMDVIIHMAADPSGERGWESVLNSNVIGAYNVYEAARLAGVQRVVFASSLQTVFGYRDTEPYATLFAARYDEVDPEAIPALTHKDCARPLNLYASSKVWGEALAHTYAYRHGLSCLVLRIGWVVAEDRPPNPWGQNQWCSQRDIAQLCQCCVDAPDDLRFDIFYGVSDNDYNWVDIEHAREVLGYEPLDRAEEKIVEG
ncbi:MAG: NAD(P)-dependent oxidoreductase [Anaerolineae bacterium]|nr:NAD(P)-dependent oxidoreductase [Anaerolineae bacterium]